MTSARGDAPATRPEAATPAPATTVVGPRAWIGTSGWSYPSWRNDFYGGTPRSGWLAYCAARFSALEINSTFYRRQRADTLAAWADAVPDDFVFAFKAHRFFTHPRLLADPEGAIRRERDRAASLGSKLGAVLWQLPARLEADQERLAAFAGALAREWPARHAVELRHASWFTAGTADVLRQHGIASCISDAADWPCWDAVTAPFVYVRLHGHTRTYASRYADASLRRWAARVAGWLGEGRDVHVYFDNDAEGAAPWDAVTLRRLVAAAPEPRGPEQGP